MNSRLDEAQQARQHAVKAFCRDRTDGSDVAPREGKPAPSALWSGLAELEALGAGVVAEVSDPAGRVWEKLST